MHVHTLGLVAHALHILDAAQVGVDLGNSRGDHSQVALPPIQRVSVTAAAAATAAGAGAGAAAAGRPPSGGSNGGSSPPNRPESPSSHARSAQIKLQACTTIKLSPLMVMNDAGDGGNNGFDERGDQPPSGGGGGGGGSSARSGGSGSFGGGLLVASVSECDSGVFGDECDSSAFGDGFSEGGASGGGLADVEEDGDSDTDDDKEPDLAPPVAQRHGSVYEDRFRQRSAASQQFMELADTVASDVAKGGSPAHSHLIQRMTLVSCCPSFHAPN